MKKVPQILLKAYLRRNPVHVRLSQFNFLSRYAWLKNVLEELRPELFPGKPAAEAVEELAEDLSQPPETASQFIGQTVRGQLGSYRVERWRGQRGQGQLFEGICQESGEAVAIKEFLLPREVFSPAEAQARQEQFVNLGLLRLADGRQSHFRAIRPVEAIADDKSLERCYLISPATDLGPSLRTHLATHGAVPPVQARRLLAQLLQTLDFLHRQKFSLANGQQKTGLLHGRFGPDCLLWSQIGREPFLYLCDFQQWEQLFALPPAPPEPLDVSREAVQQELRAVAEIGFYMLQGKVAPEALDESARRAGLDPDLEQFLRQLIDPSQGFTNADKAHQALLRLPPLYSSGPVVLPDPDADAKPKARSKLSVMAALTTLFLLGGIAWTVMPRIQRSRASGSEEALPPSVCCLGEISAVPAGRFSYTAVEQGSWQFVTQQPHLLRRNQSLTDALAAAQPELQLNYRPSSSITAALDAVERGEVDFAVVPLLTPLPVELRSEAIAYDGLAIVVPFSYGERRKGLPKTLNGQISLPLIQELYSSRDGQMTLPGSRLPVGRLAPVNPEAIEVFEQRVLGSASFETLGVEQQPTLPMLRDLIRRFENDKLGGIGFSSLSQIRGQCSVYPLAIQGVDDQGNIQGKAIQPLMLNNGQVITPETDLCDRKGNYKPNVTAFKSGDYPLGYPVAVVYASDNRRVPIGQKFAELLQTDEGQQLLGDAGLVPLEDFWTRTEASQ